MEGRAGGSIAACRGSLRPRSTLRSAKDGYAPDRSGAGPDRKQRPFKLGKAQGIQHTLDWILDKDPGSLTSSPAYEAEHVHLLINYPPKPSVSSLVNSLKGVSSRLLRRERPDIDKHYWKNVLWSPSYFAASCGGTPLNVLKQYVEQQKTPL